MTADRRGGRATRASLLLLLSLGLLAVAVSVGTASARSSGAAGHSRKRHKEVIGEILRVELVGGFHYTFDNSLSLANAECGSDSEEENWSPSESHSVIGMKWKTVYPRVRVLAPDFGGASASLAKPLFKGTTTFKEHSFEAHGFYYNQESGACRGEQKKATISCAGKVNPGTSANLQVFPGNGYASLSFAVFPKPEALSLSPPCVDSIGHHTGNILVYYRRGSGGLEHHELLDVNSMAQVGIGENIFQGFAAAKGTRKACVGDCQKREPLKFPQRAQDDCSVPNEPEIVAGSHCTQTEDPRSLWVEISLLRRIYD